MHIAHTHTPFDWRQGKFLVNHVACRHHPPIGAETDLPGEGEEFSLGLGGYLPHVSQEPREKSHSMSFPNGDMEEAIE